MQNRPTSGDDRARGETSKAGFANSDDPKPPQDNLIRPALADPAEGESHPPAHPTRDDGLGKNDDSPNQAVPPGDPMTESDRTDLQ